MNNDISDMFEVGGYKPDIRTKWQKFWEEVKWFLIIVAVGAWLGWFIHTWSEVIVINSLLK